MERQFSGWPLYEGAFGAVFWERHSRQCEVALADNENIR
jgi:hypothetical protein